MIKLTNQICKTGLLMNGICDQDQTCSEGTSCSSCTARAFPIPSETCSNCAKGYVGELVLENGLTFLKCRVITKRLEGCVSYHDGECAMCNPGYYMNGESQCKSVSED